jgi:hypothetical protein
VAGRMRVWVQPGLHGKILSQCIDTIVTATHMLNDGYMVWEFSHLVFLFLCKQHRVYVYKPRWYRLMTRRGFLIQSKDTENKMYFIEDFKNYTEV